MSSRRKPAPARLVDVVSNDTPAMALLRLLGWLLRIIPGVAPERRPFTIDRRRDYLKPSDRYLWGLLVLLSVLPTVTVIWNHSLTILLTFVINYTFIQGSNVAWQGLASAAEPLDNMIVSAEDQSQLAAWVSRRMSLSIQVPFMIAFSVVGLVALKVAGGDLSRGAWITMLASGAVGGYGLYWVVCSIVFCYRVGNVSDVELSRIHAVLTPGIVSLQSAMRRQMWVAFAITVSGVPSEVAARYGDDHLNSHMNNAYFYGAAAIAIGSVTALAFLPRWLITRTARRREADLQSLTVRQLGFATDIREAPLNQRQFLTATHILARSALSRSFDWSLGLAWVSTVLTVIGLFGLHLHIHQKHAVRHRPAAATSSEAAARPNASPAARDNQRRRV